MHHGLCLLGGNTSEVADNGSVGGCYNGRADDCQGHHVGESQVRATAGRSRNCVRCRWSVTEPHHPPALAAERGSRKAAAAKLSTSAVG
ncbi:hypothetical protein ACUXMH_003518 [Ralstonia pickettii]|jgi:hypothetical protein